MALRAVIIRCPNCNAILEINNDVAQVKCAYCDVVSRIQPKTMMFEVPRSMPPPQTQSPQQRLHQLQQIQHLTPVKKTSAAIFVLPLLITIMVGGLGAVFSMRAGGRATSTYRAAETTRVAEAKKTFLWAGQLPALFDLDGDKTADLVGIIRYVTDNDRAALAAFNGKTGAPLWESASLGKYGDLPQMSLVPLGPLVLFVTDTGTITAHDTRKAGAPAWTIKFDEKIAIVCEGGADAVVLETADDRWIRVDVAGAQTPTKKLIRLDQEYTKNGVRAKFDRGTDVCLPIGRTWGSPRGVLALQRWSSSLGNIEGMNIELLVRRPGSTGSIAVGYKATGTSVPMLAKVEGKNAVWSIVIPGSNPLNARFDAKLLAVTETTAFAIYETSQPSAVRITAIDLATGERRWERDIATGTTLLSAEGLVVTGDVLLLPTWQTLRAFSTKDGSDVFTVGTN